MKSLHKALKVFTKNSVKSNECWKAFDGLEDEWSKYNNGMGRNPIVWGDCPKTQMVQNFSHWRCKIGENFQCNFHFATENRNKNGIESHRLLVFGRSEGGEDGMRFSD